MGSAAPELVMVERTIPAGTIVHLQGIPLRLTQDAVVKTTDENWQLATETPETADGR